jgi:hypothetical protein
MTRYAEVTLGGENTTMYPPHPSSGRPTLR